MSENSQPLIILSRSKKNDYVLFVCWLVTFSILYLIETSPFRYIGLLGVVVCLGFISSVYVRPVQKVSIFDKYIFINYGEYKFSTPWEDIIAVDFKRAGGGTSGSSGPFRIITKEKKSIPLGFMGWFILEKSDSPEIYKLIQNLRPIRSTSNVLPFFYNIKDENERLQLILDIIEMKSGIQATFHKVL